MLTLLVLRWGLRILVGVVLLGIVVVGVTAGRIWWVARQDARPPSDAILVLGAAQFDGRPSAVLEARLRHTRLLYRQDVAPRIVTVGGKLEGDRFTEAGSGRRWLVEHGVPADDVMGVPEGNSTLESLRAADEVFEQRGWDSVVLVTDPWHSLRARTMARDLGLEAEASPTRTGPTVGSLETKIHYIARETAAYLYYEIFHRSYDGGIPAL